MINLMYYKEGYMKLTVLSFHLSLALALALTVVVLGGCGIKPAKVSPPPSVVKDTFPQTYPDPATDPKPQPESPTQP
jgi:hypothetical protein